MTRVYEFDLQRAGGEWLGALRNRVKWIRCFGNGESVTWGSNDRIDPPLTIGEAEELGAYAAAAAINSDRRARDARWLRVVRRLWRQRDRLVNALRQLEEPCAHCIDYCANCAERRWIPVSERLPEVGTSVVLGRHGEPVWTGMLSEDDVWESCCWTTPLGANDAPTHWRPRPDPPEAP